LITLIVDTRPAPCARRFRQEKRPASSRFVRSQAV